MQALYRNCSVPYLYHNNFCFFNMLSMMKHCPSRWQLRLHTADFETFLSLASLSAAITDKATAVQSTWILSSHRFLGLLVDIDMHDMWILSFHFFSTDKNFQHLQHTLFSSVFVFQCPRFRVLSQNGLYHCSVNDNLAFLLGRATWPKERNLLFCITRHRSMFNVSLMRIFIHQANGRQNNQ